MRQAIWTLDEVGVAADRFIAILASPRRMTISRPASERRLTRGDWSPCHCTSTGEETSRVS
ncbi:MAG: hypothetical protein GY871_01380, partial [Actinomycetales bacterium]|nr:hypothetical protein [Actinomycetales bacterium]